jgi:hypothetical protein
MTNANAPMPSPSFATDEWLDRVLADDARVLGAHYVLDEGFTAAFMQRLPAPVALPAWRKPVVVALWLVAGVLLASMLPQAMQDLAREAFRVVAAKPVTLSMLGMLLAAIGIVTWTGTALALRRD